MNEALQLVRRHALAALMPPPRLTLSDWIESNLCLPGDVSSMPGAVRLWPFQREIADAIGNPLLERVTLIKPVRVGFTTLLTGALASYVANDPAPVLCLLPTEHDARDYMVSDIEPIFSESPAIDGLLSADNSDTDRNTLLHRRFPGGSLKVVAAKAPRNLRRHNVRVLLCDEVDGMDDSVEGSPLTLAERRTLSFADRKIVIGSTPIFETTSRVLRSYAQSDARVFEVPCPACGVFNEILWQHIEWPEGKPAEAFYRCPDCEEAIDERCKPEMIAAGRWRATAPEIEGHAGFRLNALVSLLANAAWGKLAVEFIAAKDDPSQLQTFVNTILGQGWRDEGETLDDADLANRREDFGLDQVPADVLTLTAGVDVQRDRIEVTFLGWKEDGECLVLAHHVVWGSPHEGTSWGEIDALLKERWPHALGGTIGLDAAIVDSGDGETVNRVYAFCQPRQRRRIFAGKGMAGNRIWAEPSKSKKLKGVRLFIVGVDGIKSHVYNRLGTGRSIRFSKDLPLVWFEQLASERVVVKYHRGQPTRQFERIPGRAAEALDCVVYGFAARQLVHPDWLQRRDQLSKMEKSSNSSNSPGRVIRSNWMQ